MSSYTRAKRFTVLPWVLGLALSHPLSAWACATCGCSLSTDAAMGYSAAPGWRVDLQYDYLDQSQLRSGTGTVAPADSD